MMTRELQREGASRVIRTHTERGREYVITSAELPANLAEDDIVRGHWRPYKAQQEPFRCSTFLPLSLSLSISSRSSPTPTHSTTHPLATTTTTTTLYRRAQSRERDSSIYFPSLWISIPFLPLSLPPSVGTVPLAFASWGYCVASWIILMLLSTK